MKNKYIISILSLMMFFAIEGKGQDIRIFDSVLSTKIEKRQYNSLKNYTLAHISSPGLEQIARNEIASFTSTLPLKNGNRIPLSFVRFDITTPDFTVYDGNDQPQQYNEGNYYIAYSEEEGDIAGAFSFYPGSIMAIFEWQEDIYNIGNIDDSTCMILKENDIIELPVFECETDESMIRDVAREDTLRINNVDLRQNRCIEVYLEADYKLYLKNGKSVDKTVNYLLGLFAETVLLYQNEDINMRVAAIKVWTIPDGYSTSSSGDALSKFANRYNPNNKDLNVLVALGGKNLGGLAYLNVLCSHSFNYAYTNIDYFYNNIPLYSWSAMVITHELGHNIGSLHTHACAWNGNYTQIDDCGNIYYNERGRQPEGYYCFDEENPILPVDGGTIMSYCHLTHSGINLSKGFGPQPGDVIRRNYNNAYCLETCNMYGDSEPVADFEAARTFTCEGGYLKFIDKSLNHPVIWEWTIEKDDSIMSVNYHKNPKIKFEQQGIYDASLWVKNGKGEDKIIKKDYIQVIEGPVPAFEYTLLSENEVQFINKSVNAQKYRWEFGDGLHRFKKNPVHTYKYPGKYFVTLYATRDTCHTTNSITDTIELKFPVPAKIRFNEDIICSGDSIFFYCGEAPYDSVRWHFEGAAIASSNERQLWVTYDSAGQFDVKIIAYSIYGNDTLVRKNIITVRHQPEGDFEYTASHDTVSFFHKFEYADILEWDFGDGQTSGEKNPVHVYGKTGKFNVTLKAINTCGRDVINKEIVISKTGTLEPETEIARIYPNPARYRVFIELNEHIDPNDILTVKNILGKTVLQLPLSGMKHGANRLKLDTRGLDKGIYFIYFNKYKTAYKLTIE